MAFPLCVFEDVVWDCWGSWKIWRKKVTWPHKQKMHVLQWMYYYLGIIYNFHINIKKCTSFPIPLNTITHSQSFWYYDTEWCEKTIAWCVTLPQAVFDTDSNCLTHIKHSISFSHTILSYTFKKNFKQQNYVPATVATGMWLFLCVNPTMTHQITWHPERFGTKVTLIWSLSTVHAHVYSQSGLAWKRLPAFWTHNVAVLLDTMYFCKVLA